ncbi:MAG: serine/threonine protein phosphatase [Oligoflexia bacterium]|nr:serine/threonine protein phosphatase [Oligoflexia bacterium]
MRLTLLTAVTFVFTTFNAVNTFADCNTHIVIGDLHGSMFAVEHFLERVGCTRGEDKLWQVPSGKCIVFAGDYFDRGGESLEVYDLVMNLKTRYPSQVTPVLGNHEAMILNGSSSYSLFNGAAAWLFPTLKEQRECCDMYKFLQKCVTPEGINTCQDCNALTRQELQEGCRNYLKQGRDLKEAVSKALSSGARCKSLPEHSLSGIQCKKIGQDRFEEVRNKIRKDMEQGKIVLAHYINSGGKDFVVSHAGITKKMMNGCLFEGHNDAKKLVEHLNSPARMNKTVDMAASISINASERSAADILLFKNNSPSLSPYCANFNQIKGHEAQNSGKVLLGDLENGNRIAFVDVGASESFYSGEEFLKIDNGVMLPLTNDSPPSPALNSECNKNDQGLQSCQREIIKVLQEQQQKQEQKEKQ